MTLTFEQARSALSAFTLELDVVLSGRVTVVFGASGSGKTSLLEILAGLRRLDAGRLSFGESIWDDPARRAWVPPAQRRIGYVPQDLALFPHLTVGENLRFGRRHAGERGAPPEWAHLVEVLEIGHLLDRRVQQLSGGEKQRVALGRALVPGPCLLLLDEPLSSLDEPLRRRLLRHLTRVRDEFRVPMILVTHDRSEALAVGDAVMVLERGRVLQVGPVDTVFGRPASVAVAGVVGTETVRPGRVELLSGGLAKVVVGSASLWAADPGGLTVGADVYVCIRAEEVMLFQGASGSGSPRNALDAVVMSIGREGVWVRVMLDAGFELGALLTSQAAEEMGLIPGSAVRAMIKAPSVHVVAR